MRTVYTIGHSNHDQRTFVSLLRTHAITAVADVRSTPYSGYNPQYDREILQKSLLRDGVRYAFLGAELGARSSDPTCYERGVVQFERLARTQAFESGLDRIVSGAQQYSVALMCAEKEPLECHRTILVARELRRRGVEVAHIHADGSLEQHEDALSRLARMLGVREREQHLFCSAEEVVDDLYRMQEKRIAYETDTLTALPAA